ncbi:MAG: orotidine-5'-phosphate decarboxylase [Myxococcales bacterium]|nr:orotidine-5'-phosphate decarboxylase [Myxococcales bacterium]
MRFSARLSAAIVRTGTPLCVGIDPWADRLPGRRSLLQADRSALAALSLRFGLAVVAACADVVPSVKPQFAFFEALGPAGMAALAEVCRAAQAAGLLVVGDAKRGDIGSTASAYAAATLGPDAPFPCDALTVSPYCGPDTLEPFVQVARAEHKGLFVLLRTSNPGSARWQAPVADDLAAWIEAQNTDGDPYGPVGAVLGATHREAHDLRARLPRTWLLVPGFGAQGGSAGDARALLHDTGLGALINSSRGATFPAAPDDAYDDDPAAWIRARVLETRAELARG